MEADKEKPASVHDIKDKVEQLKAARNHVYSNVRSHFILASSVLQRFAC
jgi:hypothetical protein